MVRDSAYVMLTSELDYRPYLEAFAAASVRGGCRRWIDLGSGGGGPAADVARRLTLERIAVDSARPPGGPPPGWRFREISIESFLDEAEDMPDAIVTMLDVVEHFEKSAGEHILDRLTRASAAVAVFTPWGLLPQEPSVDPGLEAHPAMWHRSGWDAQDLLSRNFVVLAMPMFHSRRGALFAVGRRGWSLAERERVARDFTALYFRRLANPLFAYRRFRATLFYWLGETRGYRWCRRAIRGLRTGAGGRKPPVRPGAG